jgi:hypothetical protein
MRYLPNLQRFPAISLLAIASTVCLYAGELKVDINRDTKNTATQTAVGYTQWTTASSGGTTSTGTTPISKNFTSATGEAVTVSLAMTAAAQAAGGTGLNGTYYQAGVAIDGQKLVSDGVTVAPNVLNAGGQIQMTLTGLSAGPHTLLTYHNAGDSPTLPGGLGTMAPIKVYLNGTYVTAITPSIRSTDILTPIVYLEFNTASTTSVTTVLFAADTAATANTKNVVLNGFEIDTPNSTRIANAPVPADADEHVNADTLSVPLSWSAATAGTAVSHDVYFGTGLTAVKTATRASAAFLGNQTGLTRSVSVADPFATYYWRVDEIDSLGNATAGTVWYFRPRHLAFPGAEGYGRFARGGRGGRVVHVTSLADYAVGATPIPGTLRYAVEVETGPRVIIFDLGGIITVDHRLTLAAPYVTLAGQTAPGKGICLSQWPLGLSGAKDAVIRFLRNRPGNLSGQTIDGGGLAGCDHSIMDHCSISWSIDEAFSSRSAKNISLQNTLISEALNIAGHQNYPAGTAHGYAATIGGDKGSFHHNLLAHCEGRNWSLGGGLDASGTTFAGRLDITNNVVYNWRGRTTDGGAMEVNFVNNYYKPGAATTLVPYALTMQHEDNFAGSQRAYFAGNVMAGYFTEASQTVGRRSVVSSGIPTPTYETFVAAPFFGSFITTQTATGAYKRVLSDVGANRPLDDHDARVIRETLTGTYTYTGTGPYGGYPGLPNSQTDVGGWEDYPTVSRPTGFDTDADGLPDWWETLHGTNPASPANDFTDPNADPDADGYTRLDDYLAWLALPRLETTAGASVEFDLSTLTTGYTNSLVRSVQLAPASASAGLVQLLPDGKTVRFTPSGGFTGLARFTHTVTDATSDSLSGEIGIRVAPANVTVTPTLSITRDGDTLTLFFTGSAGLQYSLQQATDFSDWTNFQVIAATGTLQSITVPPELFPAPRRFFRAVR